MSVRVAPREIRDLVYRIERIRGTDPGSAEGIASHVVDAEVARRPVLARWAVLGTCPSDRESPTEAQRQHAARRGLQLPTGLFDHLVQLAEGWLVAEATLDAIDGEPVA